MRRTNKRKNSLYLGMQSELKYVYNIANTGIRGHPFYIGWYTILKYIQTQ